MSTSALFTPLQLSSHTIRNRIVTAALTRNRAPGSIPNDIMKEYYVQCARGGAGLIVTEGTLVTPQGTEWPHVPGIWNFEQSAAWRNIVDAVHAEGSKIYVQLWHLGRLSHPDAPEQKLSGMPVYAPSAISARGGRFRHIPGEPGYVTPTEIEDPWTLVKMYKDAAVHAKKKQDLTASNTVQGAGGYLIAQFLDYTANQRNDQWGGSIENRARFGLEVLKAVKEVFGNDVSIKLGPTGGFNDVGMPLQDAIDTFSYFINEADTLGLSYFLLMQYTEAFDPIIDGKRRAIQHDILRTYVPLVKNSKVIANAGITPEAGAVLVSSGKVDAIAFGVPYIAHPDLAKRVEHGKPLDNIPSGLYFQRKGEEDMRVGYTDYPLASY
ncbi:flavoprotein NADH-dependent oxidoreductase [Cyathus striatus]|nr:flavoprotein NADH-dependent oxidoreductase [Cyathus striatus]